MPNFRSASIVAIACGLLALPLAAQVADGPGVTVDLGDATLLHRSPVQYPTALRAKGVQGTVVIELTLDSNGAVVDMNVVSGPDELRRAVMESALSWHFSRSAAGGKRQIKVAFKNPAPATPLGPAAAGPPPPPPPPGAATARNMNLPRIASIEVVGLPDSARDELIASLPFRPGDVPTLDALSKASAAVRAFDEHLNLSLTNRPEGMEVRVIAPGATPTTVREGVTSARVTGTEPSSASSPQRPRVSAKVTRQVAPQYPPLALQARISGAVTLEAVISKEGKVLDLRTVSGHPLLVPAALDAARQWEFEPTLLNGNPVDVISQITLQFQLPNQTAAK